MENVFIFLLSTWTGTAYQDIMQLQLFDQRKFSGMFNDKEQNAYTVATCNKSE